MLNNNEKACLIENVIITIGLTVCCFFALNCEQCCSRNHDVGDAVVFVYCLERTRSDIKLMIGACSTFVFHSTFNGTTNQVPPISDVCIAHC